MIDQKAIEAAKRIIAIHEEKFAAGYTKENSPMAGMSIDVARALLDCEKEMLKFQTMTELCQLSITRAESAEAKVMQLREALAATAEHICDGVNHDCSECYEKRKATADDKPCPHENFQIICPDCTKAQPYEWLCTCGERFHEGSCKVQS